MKMQRWERTPKAADRMHCADSGIAMESILTDTEQRDCYCNFTKRTTVEIDIEDVDQSDDMYGEDTNGLGR